MPQRQFTNYQADILSFELREAMLGILKPGRYGGFTSMATGGAPSEGLIPIIIGHGTAVKKSSHADTPVLSSGYGIVVTPQGSIIHEDTSVTSLAVAENSTGDSRWDLVVMTHTYLDSTGDNPGTYSIQQGTVADTIPTLANPEIETIIGYILLNGDDYLFADLLYYPAQSEQNYGDIALFQKLFGNTTPELVSTDNIGTIPADGVIGDRKYVENNFLIDGESITDSLDILDMEVFDNFGLLTGIGARALDNASWGALTDITTQNSSTSKHGLLHKLSGVTTQFLNGNGAWTAPPGKRLVWRDAAIISDFDIATGFGNFAATSGVIDLSSIVPADCDIAWIRVAIYSVLAVTTEVTLSFQKDISTGGTANMVLAPSGASETKSAYLNTIMGLTSSRTLRWFTQGNAAANVLSVYLAVLAWQTTS